MQNRKPMVLVFAGPNGSGKSTITQYFDNSIEPVRIVRKHKEDITVFPNDLWSEEKLIDLIRND